MSRLRILIIGAAAIALVAVGSFLLMPRAANKTTVTPTPSSRATPSPSASASVYPVPQSGAPSAAAWPTANYEKAFKGALPPSPQLTAIRTGTHASDGYDRIAFDFKQANAPGYRVQYATQVVRDGSGQSVSLRGNTFLQIVFTPAAAHNDSGQSSLASPPTNPVNTGYDELQSYVLNGDFEGHVSVALGLAAKTGFHIEEVNRGNNLWTVYIDVRR